MKPKLLIGILFLVIFSTSFVVYLLVVNLVAPHFDLSSTTKQTLEIAPDLKNSNLSNDESLEKIRQLQQKASKDLEMYENDASSSISGEKYVPMEEVGSNSSEENSTGTLDDGSVAIKAPGEERRVQHPVSEELAKPNNDNRQTATLKTNDATEVNTAFVPDSNVTTSAADESSVKLNRVVVGSYSSIDQAKQVYDKMVDSDLDVAPIIKEVKGSYTLQVGAFTDKQKADKLVDTLKNKQYSAEIKQE
ncbi:MAG: SPOR domain-containing protein [Vampirovibrionia bacterium]